MSHNELLSKMNNTTNKTEKVEGTRRYFKGNDGIIIVLPASEIEKVYDLSGFEGFCDDDIGDGNTVVLFEDKKVKVSEVSDEIEVFEFFDGHNWKKIYLTNVYEELELHESNECEYSTRDLKCHFNLLYDHIFIMKFLGVEDNLEKYGIILSYRTFDPDTLFFITKKEYEDINAKEHIGDVFGVLSNAGYEI